jgi:hypothetical protein
MPGSTTESASGSTGSFSVSVMPRSTVTPLNLFQRSRKSAISEHRNLESTPLYSPHLVRALERLADDAALVVTGQLLGGLRGGGKGCVVAPGTRGG